jgi:KRAB domain-containing zinc finger protein
MFKKPSKYAEHLLVHTGERPFKCLECNKTFKRSFHLTRHTASVHLKEKPFTCGFCGKSFTLRHQLDRHVRKIHSSDVSLQNENPELFSATCDICKAIFKKNEALRIHISTEHAGPPAFSCDLCADYSTNVKRDLCRHKKRVHSSRLYCCPVCSANFPSWSLLIQHQKDTFHKDANSPGSSIQPACEYCVHCHKSFNELATFKKHMAMHFGKWKCQTCQKNFSSSNALKVHTKTVHEGEKPYQCTHCIKPFAHKHLLARHFRNCPNPNKDV